MGLSMDSMRIKWLMVLAIGLSVSSSYAMLTEGKTQKTWQKKVPGEYLVKLKTGVSATSKKLNQKLLNAGVLEVRPLATDSELLVIKLKKGKKEKSIIKNLMKQDDIERIEPNFIYHIMGAPNDPGFTKLWGLNNYGQADQSGQVGTAGSDIRVTGLWDKGITGSRRIVVAVIDTGIATQHPDLKENIYINAGEAGDKANNGIDDDGNGFVDDVSGWNFVNNTKNSDDDHDHGTHCAGTIGALGNNDQGVVGVNWQVSLLPVKFLSATGGGTLEGAVNAINYARLMKANVMSNSWGGGGASEILKDSLEKARNAGILVVAAAGNDSSDNDAMPTYPASYAVDNIVAVAATNNQESLASFSNYGAKTVHVAAPGVKIYSTVKNGGYNYFSGTSMATPHISGIAALMWSADPELSASEIKKRLIETSVPVKGLGRKVIAHGTVSASNAVNNTRPPSTEPDPSLWRDAEYRLESEHPYKANEAKQYSVRIEGASHIRVFFEKVDLESKYDTVVLKGSKGEVIEEVSGVMENYASDYALGDSMTLTFTSDSTVQKWGFKISKVQVIRP